MTSWFKTARAIPVIVTRIALPCGAFLTADLTLCCLGCSCPFRLLCRPYSVPAKIIWWWAHQSSQNQAHFTGACLLPSGAVPLPLNATPHESWLPSVGTPAPSVGLHAAGTRVVWGKQGWLGLHLHSAFFAQPPKDSHHSARWGDLTAAQGRYFLCVAIGLLLCQGIWEAHLTRLHAPVPNANTYVWCVPLPSAAILPSAGSWAILCPGPRRAP